MFFTFLTIFFLFSLSNYYTFYFWLLFFYLIKQMSKWIQIAILNSRLRVFNYKTLYGEKQELPLTQLRNKNLFFDCVDYFLYKRKYQVSLIQNKHTKRLKKKHLSKALRYVLNRNIIIIIIINNYSKIPRSIEIYIVI